MKSWADFVDFTLFKLEVLPLRDGGESFSRVLLATGIISEEWRNDLCMEPVWCGCGLEVVVMVMLADGSGWLAAGRL